MSDNEERHEKERQVLFSNEAFTIGMLQAVSGAAVFGLLTQLSDLGDTHRIRTYSNRPYRIHPCTCPVRRVGILQASVQNVGC